LITNEKIKVTFYNKTYSDLTSIKTYTDLTSIKTYTVRTSSCV